MKLEEIEKAIGIVSAFAKLSLQVGISIGVLAIVIYCGRIEYYPTGVTIGDGFLFIAASLATSFTYILVVLGLFSVGLVLSPILQRMQRIWIFVENAVRSNNKKIDHEYVNFPELSWDKVGLLVFGLFILFLIATRIISDPVVGLSLLGSAILMGFIYGLWNTKPKKVISGNNEAERKAKIGLVIVAVIVPLVATRSQGSILDQAMKLIGVRKESAVVQISEKYSKFLESNGVHPERQITKEGAIYTKATILFQGIGTSTVIEIKGMRLVLPASELIISSSVSAN